MDVSEGKEETMKAIRLPEQTWEQLKARDELYLYQRTKDVRVRQRTRIDLLATERALVAHETGALG